MKERHDTFEEALEETRDRYAEYDGLALCNVIEVHLLHAEGGLKLHIRVVLDEIVKRLNEAERKEEACSASSETASSAS